MLNTVKQMLIDTPVKWVDASSRNARAVLAATLAVTALLLFYALGHLALNTDNEGMLDPDLRFRQEWRALKQAFPQLADDIVVVVEAKSPSQAEDVADRLVQEIQTNAGLVESVYRPGSDRFFARHGLLYLSAEKLRALDRQLMDAEPFLGVMAQLPGMQGLFTLFSRALDEGLDAEGQKVFARLFDRVAQVIRAELEQQPGALSWRDLWLEDARGPDAAGRIFVQVRPRFDYTRMAPAQATLDFVREVATRPEFSADGVRVRITGSAAMESEELTGVARDGTRATVLSFALVLALLALGVRSLRLVAAIVIALAVGLVWTAAFAAFAVGRLNLISVSFAVLFIGMGVDFGIQFALRYREEASAREATLAALKRAARGVGGALVLAAVAAAISFFAFVPTSYRGLAELGIIAGSSMAVVLAVNLTILPALLTLLGVPSAAPSPLFGTTGQTARFVARRHRALAFGAVAALLGAAALLPLLRFDFDPLNLRDPSTESVATFKALLASPDFAPYAIEILAPSLDQAQALAARLEQLDSVDKAITLASFVPGGQQEKLDLIADMDAAIRPLLVVKAPGERPKSLEALNLPPELQRQMRIIFGDLIDRAGAHPKPDGSSGPQPPDEAAAVDKLRRQLDAAQKAYGPPLARSSEGLARALDELRGSSRWPQTAIEGLDRRLYGDFPLLVSRLRDLLSPAAVAAASLPDDLRARYLTADGRARVEVWPKQNLSDPAALRHFVSAVSAVTPRASGTPVALVAGGDAVVESCIQATLLALVATALLVILLRSALDAALVLVPLLCAIAYTVAGSVLLELPLNLANIIALPLLIGLSSAFGLYMVLRWRDLGSVDALLLSSTPRAIMFSGLTTMVSFGSLMIATHPGMSQMGTLIALALSFSLLSSLLVLPALMTELERRGRNQAATIPGKR